MAIAFRRPFGTETQQKRDEVDMTKMATSEIRCGQCMVTYVLVFEADLVAGEARRLESLGRPTRKRLQRSFMGSALKRRPISR